jgi:hypothetical protein
MSSYFSKENSVYHENDWMETLPESGKQNAFDECYDVVDY